MAIFQNYSIDTLRVRKIISGDVGVPTAGNKFYVDPANGSDGNIGTDPANAFASITKAYASCTANQNDVVYYLAGSTSITLTETLTWAKNYTHLIGVCAPTGIAQRARFFLTAASTDTDMVTVSATGCVFKDLYFFHGVASTSSLNCVQVTGGRNYFENVHFAGIGHATGQGDVATARSLLLTGAEENTFNNCTIGVDTIARSTTNAELELASASVRNVFTNCKFLAFADNAGHLFIDANASGAMDRFAIFENCLFYNAIDSTATQMTEAAAIHASAGGMVIVRNCSLIGATDWEAATVSGMLYLDGAAPTAATSGLMVAAAAS